MSRTTTLGIGLTAAALTVLAPLAHAATSPGQLGFAGQSYVAKPGGTVPIDGSCTDPNFTTAKITSPALLPLDLKAGADKHFAGTANVRKNIKSGVYPVSFLCGKDKVETRLTVQVPNRDDSVVIDPGQFRATPNYKLKPGEKIDFWWNASDCGTDAKVTGPVTVGKAAHGSVVEDDLRIKAPATVAKNIKPGNHTVTLTCAKVKLTTTIHVAEQAPGKVSVKPKGAPETGGGPVA